MTRKEKRKIMFLIAIALLIFVTFIVFAVRYANNVEDENKEKGNVGKGTVIEKVNDSYDGIYYARTEYKDQDFRVVFDSPQKDDSHWIRYTLFDERDIDDITELESYQPDVPVNTVIEEYLEDGEYQKKVGGRDLFTASQDVTTIIIIDDTEVKYEEPTTYGYAVTYVSNPGSESIEDQIERFAAEATNENGLGIDAYALDLQGEELSQYLTANNFKKYNKTK